MCILLNFIGRLFTFRSVRSGVCLSSQFPMEDEQAHCNGDNEDDKVEKYRVGESACWFFSCKMALVALSHF